MSLPANLSTRLPLHAIYRSIPKLGAIQYMGNTTYAGVAAYEWRDHSYAPPDIYYSVRNICLLGQEKSSWTTLHHALTSVSQLGNLFISFLRPPRERADRGRQPVPRRVYRVLDRCVAFSSQ